MHQLINHLLSIAMLKSKKAIIPTQDGGFQVRWSSPLAAAVPPELHGGTLRLIYNHVAKAASYSMLSVLKAAAQRNHFKLSGPHPGEYARSTEALTAELQTVEPGGAWVNHAATVTQLLNDPRFAWINVVREPLDRAQSLYYYEVDGNIRGSKATAAYELRGSHPNPVCNCQRLEFSECVEQLLLTPSCNFTQGKAGRGHIGHSWAVDSQMRYFCEKRESCTFEAATRNYDDYLFVGISEELDLTLRVFEEILPSWFRGASSNPVPHSDAASNANRMAGTQHAGAVSKTARGLLMRDPFIADEVRFYDFCRRKFWLAVVQVLGDTSGDVAPASG